MADRLKHPWLLWSAGGVVAAIVVAWIAARFHAAGLAPLGILPLGVGVVFGAILVGLAATIERRQPGRRLATRPLVVGAVLLALVVGLAQHAWLYHDFRRQWHAARAASPEVAMFRPAEPWSPGEYFAHEASPQRSALWLADTALIAAAAAGAVLVWQRCRP